LLSVTIRDAAEAGALIAAPPRLSREKEGFMPAQLTDEARGRLHDRLSICPDAELLATLLALHKALEHNQIGRTRDAIERETVVLSEVFKRWIPEEVFDQAEEMVWGDGKPWFPDFDSLGLAGDNDA
jgi:hypothetical protein